jgi:PAS domain S-box-containing protein
MNTIWRPIAMRVVIPTGMTVLFFLAAFYFIMIPTLKRSFIADKQEMIRELNNTVWELLNNYHQRTLTGELSLSEAQYRAKERIRALRYGNERKDYFWINDMHPRMIMHPYRPELEGQDLTDYPDADGQFLFRTFVQRVRLHHAGFVEYQWQWKDNPSLVAPKLSYVQGFEPWGWIIGTGIYKNDVDAHIADATRHLKRIFAVILFLVTALSGVIIWDSSQIEKRRQDADAARQRMTRIVESTSDVIAMATVDGRVTYINAAGRKLLGWSDQENSPHLVQEAHPEWAAKLIFEKGIPTALEQGIWTSETALKDANGSEIPVSQVIMAHRSSRGAVEYLSTIIRDLRPQYEADKHRRRLEAQIQHAQKLESLGVLAGGIAHDFNNILLAIMGNVTLALDVLPKNDPIRPALLDIETATARASDLTRQMLAYSGKGHFTQEAIDLSLLVQELMQMLRVSISKKAELQSHLDPNLPLVQGDATQIRQVVMNLITNASDALFHQSGIISIRTGSRYCDHKFLEQTYLGTGMDPGEYVFVEVRDTGCGMNEETKARIFEPFFTTKFTGRGLGLAAVLGIVRTHKGTLQVDSVCGRGTCIQVYLPAARHLQRMQADTPVDEQSATSMPGHNRGTILVVDDEPAVSMMARRILETKGFAVMSAQDGLEGVALFQKHVSEISCIIMDLTMPRMDGQEAMAEVLKIHPEARIIISSGYSEEQLREQFTDGGPIGFILKPYKASELIAAVMGALKKPITM